MNLLFLIASLDCGGAQRAGVTLLDAWAARGWTLTAATLDRAEGGSFFPLDPRVRLVPLGVAGRSRTPAGAILANVRRARAVRRLLREVRPDVVLSFGDTTNVLALVAAAGLGVPVVVSERVDPGAHDTRAAWRMLRRLTYPAARRIVVQTARAGASLPASWRGRMAVVPNVVPAGRRRARAADPPGGRRTLLAAGRLHRQKGFDVLLDAFARVAPGRPAWDLEILGEGEERGALERQAAALRLEGRVRLPGRVDDVEDRLARADAFVLSSRYEGFPNALAEAMAAGLPCVASDCPSGPAELVEHGVDGLLVRSEDAASLADALGRVMDDEALRSELGARAAVSMRRYAPEAVLPLWERALRGPA